MKRAAAALGLTPGEVRAAVRADPRLLDSALDIAERRLDEAEAAIKQALRRGPLERRMIAALALLTLADKLR